MDGNINIPSAATAPQNGQTAATAARIAGGGAGQSRAKRAGDLVCAGLALAFTAPLLIAIGLLIKAQDGGPVFYRHVRCGRHGKAFTLLKFRTMRPDADAQLARLLATDPTAQADWDMHHKLRKDPRITPIGRWLRRSSIDELPQLLNILRGDMSVIGPRPITRDELDRYGENERDYASVRPGLTGLWQVSGRNETDFDTRVRLDSEYVRTWSLAADVQILLRTVPAVLSGRGAY